MRRSLPLLSFSLFFASCANEPKQVDDQLLVKGSLHGQKIGFDDENRPVLQEEEHADQELRTQLFVNNKLSEDLAYETNHLQRCRDDLADPRLGGHGFASEVPAMNDFATVDKEEEIGLDGEGNYKVVKRQDFVKKLTRERRVEQHLRKVLKLTLSASRECDQKMKVARIRVGLPPSRYEAQGYFTTDGTWVTTRRAERSLDDAFAISAKHSEDHLR